MNFSNRICICASLALLSACSGDSFPDYTQSAVSARDESDAALALAPAPRALEGNGTASVVTLVVARTGALQDWISVRYSTRDLTATAGKDYVAVTNGELHFEPYEEEKTIAIEVLGDTMAEPDEAFVVSLNDPAGAILAFDTQAVLIQDDDRAQRLSDPCLAVRIVNSGVMEQGPDRWPDYMAGSEPYSDAPLSLSFAVIRTGGDDLVEPLVVDYSTHDGSAQEYSDYYPESGSLTFTHGEYVKWIRVSVYDDDVKEKAETLTVELSTPSCRAAIKHTATGTILDDDSMRADGTIEIGGMNQYCERLLESPTQPGALCMAVACATGRPLYWSQCPDQIVSDALGTLK